MTTQKGHPSTKQKTRLWRVVQEPFRPALGFSSEGGRRLSNPYFYLYPVLAVAAILGVIAMAVSVGTVLATPGSGFTRTVQGSATLEPFRVHTDDFEIQSKNTTDVVMAKFTVDVGGDTGWHTHPGPTLITIAKGQFKLINFTEEDGCTEQVFGPGEGFVESPNVVHIGRSVGEEPVVGYVTFLNVPVGGAPLDPSPEAPDCDTASGR
jgi:quercetin dioxygenase-like cupin family protein